MMEVLFCALWLGTQQYKAGQLNSTPSHGPTELGLHRGWAMTIVWLSSDSRCNDNLH